MANYLDVPSGGGAHTPNQAGLAAGSTTVDLRVEAAADNWGGGSFQALVGQMVLGNGSGSRFWLGINNAIGQIEYVFVNSLLALVDQNSVATGFTNGTSHGVRALHNISAGTLDFYTSSDFSSWTSLGTQITGLATTGMDTAGTSPQVQIGTDPDAENFAGKMTRTMVIINGVTVLNMDWTTATVGNGPWVATSGETWTRDGTASVIAAPVVVSGPRPQAVPFTRGAGGGGRI